MTHDHHAAAFLGWRDAGLPVEADAE